MEQMGRLGDNLTDGGCEIGSLEEAFPAEECIRSLLVLAYLCSFSEQLNGSLAILLYTGHTVFSWSSPEGSAVPWTVLSSWLDSDSL